MAWGNKIIGFGLVIMLVLSIRLAVMVGNWEENRRKSLELRVEQLEDDARELKQANPGITTNND